MKILQLRCFVILSETLSFSHTAEILHLTQPAVSHQIKKLESQLNFQLFIRNKQAVELTDAGKYFYQDVKEILSRLTLAINDATSISQGTSRLIKIGYEGYDLERYNLPRIINQIKARLTRTDVMVVMASQREQRNALLSQKVQLILTPRDNIESTEGVIYKELISSGLDCVVAADHPLRHQQTVQMADLASERLIFLDPTKSPKELSGFVTRLHKLLPDCQYSYVDSTISANILIQSNSGVALIPTFTKSLDPNLYRIPFQMDMDVSYGVAWLKEHATDDIKLCASIIKENFQVLA